MTKFDLEVHGVSFKNFIKLNNNEIIEVLNWRNHEQVRSMMISKEIISINDHIQFIEKLKKTNEKVYWVAIFKGKLIGVVDLYNINEESAFWGYYLNPEYIGSSYGILLEYLILEIAFKYFELNI